MEVVDFCFGSLNFPQFLSEFFAMFGTDTMSIFSGKKSKCHGKSDTADTAVTNRSTLEVGILVTDLW